MRASFAILLLISVILPGGASAQTQLAAPGSWCLHWTDWCSDCRRGVGDKVICRPGQGNCTPQTVQCLRADEAALLDACAEVKRARDSSCNKCTSTPRGQLCTAVACAEHIICV